MPHEQLLSRTVRAPLPTYDGHYTDVQGAPQIRYVYLVNRDALMEDLIDRILRP